MNKILFIFTLFFSSVLFTFAVSADKIPGDENITNIFGPRDRNESSPKHNILNDYITAYSESHTLYDRMVFLCLSSQNTLNGACPTSENPSSSSVSGETNITLQFTEKRSLIKRELQIKGYKRLLFKGANCPSYLTLNSAHYTCNRNSASGASLYLYIPAGELKNLPFGGIWDATLKLRVKRRYDQTYGTYTINITVKLTDKGNIQIWLPQFKSDARVDLNLRPTGGGTYIGRNSVDMCFYDGYSTNSSSLELRFQDNNPKSDGKFYLRKINDDTKEIAYTLSLLLAGKSLTPTNGTSLNIADAASLEINWNRITAVTMPEISVPVLCWPGRLQLDAKVENPEAGQYMGNINITFTPSSQTL